MFNLRRLLFLSAIFLLACPCAQADNATAKTNIVLILADDMGYSDLGCFGSEIPTPNLDALAAHGLRLTQFYNTARCSPTRAALLTGLHPHQAGMGRLAEEAIGTSVHHPDGYLGYLSDRTVTLAEVLRSAGYRTCMAGKWHLGMRDESKWPLQRGFDRYYGILTGATSYFRPTGPRNLTLDNKPLPAPTNADFYTSDAFTDFAIQNVRDNEQGTPFFLYLAFNAPHWPLHARKEDIAKFVGKYREGWDTLRKQRYARQKELGIVNEEWALPDRDAGARAWETLTEKQQIDLDYRMAVYAAQVHRLDWNVGRLVDTLRQRGQLENTLILFLSDNGACAEPYTDLGGGEQAQVNDPAVMGAISYGTGWANLSDTPYRKFKSMLHEGGISAPLIVHWPAGLKIKAGALNSTPGYLTDIMPTVLQISGANYPKVRRGQSIPPLEGRSLVPIFSAESEPAPERTLFWEQYGFQAVRSGDLKAVFSPANLYDRLGSGKWELYDLANDRTELHNLATQRPDDLKTLIARWQAWADRAQVFPAPGGPRKNESKTRAAPPDSE